MLLLKSMELLTQSSQLDFSFFCFLLLRREALLVGSSAAITFLLDDVQLSSCGMKVLFSCEHLLLSPPCFRHHRARIPALLNKNASSPVTSRMNAAKAQRAVGGVFLAIIIIVNLLFFG